MNRLGKAKKPPKTMPVALNNSNKRLPCEHNPVRKNTKGYQVVLVHKA